MKNHSRNPCLPMWLVVVCLCVTSVAQISLPPGLAVADTQPTTPTPKDPFGRQSPQSAVLNFQESPIMVTMLWPQDISNSQGQRKNELAPSLRENFST